MNVVLYICSIFLLSVFIFIVIKYKKNPYIGYKFYFNKDKGDLSPFYISMASVVDGNWEPIPKFNRVSCVPFVEYTKSISDWFYNYRRRSNRNLKKHKKYTNEIKKIYG